MCEFSKDQSWQADHLAYIGEQSHIRFVGKEEGKEEGREEGRAETMAQNLRTAVRKGMTPTETMNFLDVPEADRPRLRKMLEPEKV